MDIQRSRRKCIILVLKDSEFLGFPELDKTSYMNWKIEVEDNGYLKHGRKCLSSLVLNLELSETMMDNSFYDVRISIQQSWI